MAPGGNRAVHLHSDRTGSSHSTGYRRRDGSCTQLTALDGAWNAESPSDMQPQSIKAPTGAGGGQVSEMSLGIDGVLYTTTYHCHCLHAEHQGVRGHIPRVGQRILFPELPEQILCRGHMVMMDHEIALEETVKCPGCNLLVRLWVISKVEGHTEHKPQDGDAIRHAQSWSHITGHGKCQSEEDRASSAGRDK